jgi:hypothetical protein
MQAEFTHAGKLHRFEVSAPGQELPAALDLTSRACAKSPMIRFNLAFDHVDVARGVAVYQVMAFTAAS